VPDEAKLYPVFLKLADRRVVVVGAGPIAENKIGGLLSAGARVCVVAPVATEPVRRLAQGGKVDWRERPFEDADLDGAWLAVAATSDPIAQAGVAAAGERRRVFVIAVDDPRQATAYSGGVVERSPFIVAISSSGAAPALTRLLREMIEGLLPPEDWVEVAKTLRAKWQAEAMPVGDRFAELVRAFKQRAG
jgi:siroheme synthase-like protein